MALLPDNLFTEYYNIVDELITNTNIGKACTLYYPTTKTVCPNCRTVRLASGSSNIYKDGGPVPFTQGFCPYCGGAGMLEAENTESINLRVYWNKRDWIKVGNNIQVPDAEVMTIGFLTDMTKCLKARYVNLVSEQANLVNYKFILVGEPFPHGFGKSRYFAAHWKRDK